MPAGIIKLLISLLIAIAGALAALTLLKPKRPVPRPGATIVGEARAGLDALKEWFQGFLATTPHVDDERCPEARALVARIEALLAEYAANPEKDQGVHDNLQAEFDAVRARVEQWCS